MNIPGLDRLGLHEMVQDHNSTLYRLDRQGVHRPRIADRVVLWGVPVGAGSVVGSLGVRLFDIGAVLNGVAILTGGLFTLLVMIFGVQALGRRQAGAVDRVYLLVKETRANVAYATGWALTITFALMVLGGLREPPPEGVPAVGIAPWVSAVLLAAVTHLGLILLMVLNRIRIAFARL